MMGAPDHDWELPERPASGHAWLCNGCGCRGVWTTRWSWYGSLKELEDGDPLPTFCSEACRPDAAGLALIRKHIKRDAEFVLNPSKSDVHSPSNASAGNPARDEPLPISKATETGQ